jgi:2-dehydro-3-deoxyphosphogluconate aldolase/(4S)-4-hydroxy-2-oxoglutarate aldolase
VLEALAGPFPDIRFVATGGISDQNFEAFLRLPNVEAVGGAWMVSSNDTTSSLESRTDFLVRRLKSADNALNLAKKRRHS